MADHAPPPEPKLAHEMWSREICDRLDQVIRLLKTQNATLVGDRSKTVQVELTEPSSEGSKAESKSESKDDDKDKTVASSTARKAPARSTTTAKKD